MDSLELKIPPIGVGIVAVFAMWLLSTFVPGGDISIPGSVWVAVALYCVGTALTATGVITFRAAQTTIDPRVPGNTTRLVTHGIYRLTRNPMYVGFTGGILGVAVHLSNIYALLVLPLFVLYMNRFQIYPEERAMRALFEDEYSEYAERVRRWL